jgi:fluoride exporter
VTVGVVLAIAAGGVVGGLVRYGLARLWPVQTGAFPWATFTVNIVGALVLGVVTAIVVHRLRGPWHWYPLLGTGVCGALTTMSTFVVELCQLVRTHHAGMAVVYLVASTSFGLLAAWAGWRVGWAVPISGPETERARA